MVWQLTYKITQGICMYKFTINMYHVSGSSPTGNPLAGRRPLEYDQKMDKATFDSPTWQRVYQYLGKYSTETALTVDLSTSVGTPHDCLAVLLR